MANTVHLDSHAAATLKYIRATMEGAASLAVPGSAGIALGIIGLLATTLSSMSALKGHWFEIWMLASLLAAAVGSALLVRQSSLRSLRLVGTPLGKFAMCLAPPIASGLVLTGVHWFAHNTHAIPGTWLLMYGCALIAASTVTLRIIAVLGGLFAALGLAAFLLPDDVQVYVLGAGFGGLHILFGIIIGRTQHAEPG